MKEEIQPNSGVMNRKKWLLVTLHIMVWLLFFTFPHIIRPEPMGHGGMFRRIPQHSSNFWLYYSIVQNLLLIPLYYLNLLYILPRYLSTKRYSLLIVIELLAAAVQFSYIIIIKRILIPEARPGGGMIFPILTYLVVLFLAFGYYSFKESLRIEQLQKERETATLKSELQFLRWQISPHFLFNALNNMVALARKRSEKLEPLLINLSGIMRYMIYETDEAKVPLQKEAQFLESFIQLQSIRFDHVALEVNINVPDEPAYYLEPMLLIPFVENAFKHGIDLIKDPVIQINLSVADDELHFSVANKYLPGNHAVRDDAHGVGRANVEKRLELLYEKRYTLETVINGWYTIMLTIKLS